MSIVIARNFDFPPPEPVEIGNVPELFCDLAIVKPLGETVRVLLLREALSGSSRYEIVGAVHMPRSGWEHSHRWARRLVSEVH